MHIFGISPYHVNAGIDFIPTVEHLKTIGMIYTAKCSTSNIFLVFCSSSAKESIMYESCIATTYILFTYMPMANLIQLHIWYFPFHAAQEMIIPTNCFPKTDRWTDIQADREGSHLLLLLLL